MNGKKRMILGAFILICICVTACGKKQGENPYGNIIGGLGDAYAYAFLVMDYDYNILVTSDMIYDEGTEKQAAIDCDVYYYSSGEAKHIGSIESEGTAYPLSFSKSGIFAASGHSVEKYVISEKDGSLYLEKGIYETFDESGNTFYTSREGGEETSSTEKEYRELLNEYSESQIIHFSYGASGCVNEIRKYFGE